MLISQAKIDW